MRRLLFALVAVAAVAPLAAFGTASAAPAHPAAAAAHAVRPRNLPSNKCFKITDADSGGYGSLLWSSNGKIVSSHSYYTMWCPVDLGDGWQLLAAGEETYYMADHALENYVTVYTGIPGPAPTCDYESTYSANDYCEWAEFLVTGGWTIENATNGEYLTAVKSGSPVKLAASGTGDQHWAISCVYNC